MVEYQAILVQKLKKLVVLQDYFGNRLGGGGVSTDGLRGTGE